MAVDRTSNVQMHARYGITGDHKRKPANRVRLHRLRPFNYGTAYDPTLVSTSLNGSRTRPAA